MKVEKKLIYLSFVMIVLLLFLAGVAVSCGKGTPTPVVKKGRIADITWISVSNTSSFPNYGFTLDVEMKPTNNAVAGKAYTVTLYEKGKARATKKVSFTQPEINIGSAGSAVVVSFPCSEEEFNAYAQPPTNIQSAFEHSFMDLQNIFSATVTEEKSTSG